MHPWFEIVTPTAQNDAFDSFSWTMVCLFHVTKVSWCMVVVPMIISSSKPIWIQIWSAKLTWRVRFAGLLILPMQLCGLAGGCCLQNCTSDLRSTLGKDCCATTSDLSLDDCSNCCSSERYPHCSWKNSLKTFHRKPHAERIAVKTWLSEDISLRYWCQLGL